MHSTINNDPLYKQQLCFNSQKNYTTVISLYTLKSAAQNCLMVLYIPQHGKETASWNMERFRKIERSSIIVILAQNSC